MGFRKAKGEQAALKMGVYGPPGSGKSLTSLMIAEGLAKRTGKRISYVDTENGTDFYAQRVPERQVHPEAFDFDALYTRSITEALCECRKLNPAEYCALVIDSMTHLWEAAKNSYSGPTGPGGQIPMHAWSKIKKPYKELMELLLNSPMHVIICGRQGVDYGTDDDGEQKAVGYKMKAEGETAYEPHILIRMEAVKHIPRKGEKVNVKLSLAVPTAFIEKDRTGILTGRLFPNPTYADLAEPLLGLLGDKQAQIAGEDETSQKDSEALAAADSEKVAFSTGLVERYAARFKLAEKLEDVEALGKEITPALKRQLLASDVTRLRELYGEARSARGGK